MNKLNKPKRLNPGDTIGIISPSAGIAAIFPHRVDTAVATLKKLGYKVKIAEHAMNMNGYVSDSAQNRAADIHALFADKSVQAIICMIGGNHSNQLLKYLDFEHIKRNPKILMGYSDISVLHYAFVTKSDLQTFYGPCVMTQFGEHPEILRYTLEYFQRAVTVTSPINKIEPSSEFTDELLDWGKKKDLERPRMLVASKGYEWLRPGKTEGSIVGGCIPSINHLLGTEYWIDPEGSILFIDVPEGNEFGKGLSIHELDAYLADLDNVGVFKKIKGLVIGRPFRYSEEEANSLKKLISYYTAGQNYPVLYNVNIGHVDPIITVPLYARASLDSEKNIFAILDSGVQ